MYSILFSPERMLSLRPASRSAAETSWPPPGRALTLRISDWLLRSRGILMGSWKQHLPQHWQHSDMLVATHDTARHDTTRTRDTPPVSRDWLSGISGTSYLLPPPPPPRLSCFSTLLYSTSLFRHCVHQWWPKETSQCSGQTPIKIICRLFGRFRLSGRVWLKAAYCRGLTLIIKFRRSSSMMDYFWFLLLHTLDPL